MPQIHEYTEKTLLTDSDLMLLGGSAVQKAQLGNLKKYVNNNTSMEEDTAISDNDTFTIFDSVGGVSKKVKASTIKSYIGYYKPGDKVVWSNPYYTSAFLYDNKLSLYYSIQLPNKIDASVISAVLTGSLVSFNGDGGSLTNTVTLTSTNTVCTMNRDIGAIMCKTTITAPSNTANAASVLVNVRDAAITFS